MSTQQSLIVRVRSYITGLKHSTCTRTIAVKLYAQYIDIPTQRLIESSHTDCSHCEKFPNCHVHRDRDSSCGWSTLCSGSGLDTAHLMNFYGLHCSTVDIDSVSNSISGSMETSWLRARVWDEGIKLTFYDRNSEKQLNFDIFPNYSRTVNFKNSNTGVQN